MKTVQPLHDNIMPADQKAAANVVRAKLDALYAEEPSAKEEEQEIARTGVHSKHQKFIANLQASGKSVAEVQTAWHAYYQDLSDKEKHEVWQEFYQYQTRAQTKNTPTPVSQTINTHHAVFEVEPEETRTKTMKDLHKKVLHTVNAGGKLEAKHHIRGLVFAVTMASLVTGLLFFITNNQTFIAPFIQPSKSVAASPIITDGSAVGPEAKIIIPKINLEAPLVTDVPNNAEEAIQEGLEKGVTLYPATGLPGEIGNPVFFGHSSNNLFNAGAYKFVFVRLHQLEIGDTYAINYGGKQYVYKIFAREVVKPSQVDVIYARPRPVMSTLITCDPPGTSNNRLIIQAEQISPDPSTNAVSTATTQSQELNEIPSAAPSLWRRLLGID